MKLTARQYKESPVVVEISPTNVIGKLRAEVAVHINNQIFDTIPQPDYFDDFRVNLDGEIIGVYLMEQCGEVPISQITMDIEKDWVNVIRSLDKLEFFFRNLELDV